MRVPGWAVVVLVIAATAGCLLDSDSGNHAPIIDTFFYAPAVVFPDSLAQVAAEATDPDGDALSYTWSSSYGTFPHGASESSVSWRAPGIPRSCTLYVFVSDDEAGVLGELVIQVTLSSAVLVLSADSLHFPSEVSSMPLSIVNTGQDCLVWEASTETAWLSVSPETGQAADSQDVQVMVDRTTLPDGIYEGTVSFSSNGGEASVAVTMTVETHPELGLSPWPLQFGLVRQELPIEITNVGTGELEWSVTPNVSWIDVEPESGSTTIERDTVVVKVDRSLMALGGNSGYLTVAHTGGVRYLGVSGHYATEPLLTYRVLSSYPHDTGAFTQGLIHLDGSLYESTGQYGHSDLRLVRLETGEVLQSAELERQYFGEGIVVWDDRIIQLTWRNHVAFVYDLETFSIEEEFSYSTEGWGITHDGSRLIMSDGTSTLYYRDPQTFAELGQVTVTDSRGPRNNLNELEWMGGSIWANVWLTDFIARIDPASGDITGWLDLTGLLTPEEDAEANVLNGIALDENTGRVFVTGKYWPKLFDIQIMPVR